MLQKLKLMFHLELIAVQRNLTTNSAEDDKAGSKRQIGGLGQGLGPIHTEVSFSLQHQRSLWIKRQGEVQVLLSTVTQLHVMLQELCRKTEEGMAEVC